MFTALLVLQVLLGLTIIGLVLLQQGKGADMGAAFGAGASGTVFGSRGGGSFFTRATAVLAAIFFINSILLSSPVVRDVQDAPASVTESIKVEEESDVPPVDEAQTETNVTVEDVPAQADLPEVPEQAEEQPADVPGEPEAGAPAESDLPD
jgi:preprotein translocase subunit SecG